MPALPGHRQEAWEGHPEALFRVQQRLDWCGTPPAGGHQSGGALCSAGLLMTRAAVQRAAQFRLSRAETSGLRTPDCSPLPQACGLPPLPGCGKSQRRLRHVSFQTRSSSGVASAALRSALPAPAHAAAGWFTRISRPVRGQVSSGAQTSAARASVHAKRCLGALGAWRSPPSLREVRVEAACSGRCDLGLEAGDGRTSGARVYSSPPAFPGTHSPGLSPEQPPRQSLLGWSCWDGPTGLVWPRVLGIWVVGSSSVLRSLPLA